MPTALQPSTADQFNSYQPLRNIKMTQPQQRQRAEKVFVSLNVAGKTMSGADAYSALLRLIGTSQETCSKPRFLAKLKELAPDQLAIASIKELMPYALKGKSAGASNMPLNPTLAKIDDRWQSFPNTAQLMAAFSFEIGSRALNERIAALRSVRSCEKPNVLQLSDTDILELGSVVGQKACANEIQSKIAKHLEQFGGELISLAGAKRRQTITQVCDGYQDQHTKVVFSCGQNPRHPPYERDFIHMITRGCPECSAIDRIEKITAKTRQAVSLVEQGVSQKDAAEIAGVSRSAVYRGKLRDKAGP
jgi:hypothetical protein